MLKNTLFAMRHWNRAIYTVSGRERGMSEAHKSALIILAPEGVEESEAIITGDVMTRGGMQVVYAGLDEEKCPETGLARPVNCAKGARLMPTATLKDAVKQDKYDIIIIPGGPASNTLAENKCVGKLLQKQVAEGGMIGAICAGPVALMSHGIKVENVTAHYSVAEKLEKGGYKVSKDRVVVSDKVITSQGPGTAFEFGLKIVEVMVGGEKAKELIKPLCLMI